MSIPASVKRLAAEPPSQPAVADGAQAPTYSSLRLLVSPGRLRYVPDQSLLTGEVRSLIGSETPLGTVDVTPRAWRHAVECYTGVEPKDTPAMGESIAGYAIAALETDYELTTLPPLLPNSILISNQWEFERPLRMGETLHASYHLVDINERFGGRFGYSIDFRADVVYRDAEGNVVARSGRTMTQYDPAEARSEEGGG